jgi:hypothetical protein
MRAETRTVLLAIIFMTLTASLCGAATSESSLQYKTVTINKPAPDKEDISYPQFSGAPMATVAALNKWVQQQIIHCDTTGENDIEISITVLKVNEDAALINMFHDTFCEGNAYPDHGSQQYFLSLKGGNLQEVDLWNSLSDKGKNFFFKRFIKSSESLPKEDDCKSITSDEIQSSSIVFEYKDGTLTANPDFRNAIQACDDSIQTTLSVEDIRKYYPADSAAVSVLNGLSH